MKTGHLVGFLLIIGGALMLTYGHFNYTTEEKILEVGPLKATSERSKTVKLPPLLAWTLVGSGTCLVILSSLKSVREN